MKFLLLFFLNIHWLYAAPLTSSDVLKIKGSMKGEMDLSGISCLNHKCYVVSDDVPLIQILNLDLTKKEFQKDQDIILKEKETDLDLEAITFHKGQIVVTGSHGIDRKGDKKESRFNILFYDLKKNTFAEKSLTSLFKSHHIFKNYFKIKLDKNGVNIEGLASDNKHLFIGMRAPYLDGVYILEVEDSLKLVKEHFIKTPKAQGIRAMTYTNNGLLIIMGDSNPNSSDVFQGSDKNNLYFYDLKKSFMVQEFQTKNKLEAIEVVYEDSNTLKFITLSDSIKEGEPTLYVLEKKLLTGK